MNFTDPNIPINDKVDEAVRKFSDVLIESIRELDKNIEIEIDFEIATKSDGMEKASIGTISTKYGEITIFPDFTNESAKAAILNRGLVNAMIMEGFSDEEINESTIYSNMFSNEKKFIDVIALFLTCDFGLQHQK
jgi:pyruvate-formate lyase-activating enzyme